MTDGSTQRASDEHLLTIDDLSVTFDARKRVRGRRDQIFAVANVSLHIEPGETLALVGESGSGKSTLARAICGLVQYQGRIEIAGRDLGQLGGFRRREAALLRQIVFQDPYSSLNPTMTVAELIAEPMRQVGRSSRIGRSARVAELLDAVQLPSAFAARLPSELSGGQRQRVAIARAIAVEPSLVILDEALSALDVTTQRGIMDLLIRLRDEHGLSYLFIAHDLAVVRSIAHRVAVMYVGQVVEEGPTERVFKEPSHPYTEALLSAVLLPNPRVQRSRQRVILGGELPDPTSPPAGCAFHPRCPHAMDVCKELEPKWSGAGGGVRVTCHLHDPAEADEESPVLSGLTSTESS